CEPADIVALLWCGLHKFAGFDLISLQQVRPDATCRAFLDRLVNSDNRMRHGERSERCMRIENLWPDGASFFRSLTKKGRNNHTRGKRILMEIGGELSFRAVESAEESS